MASSEPFIRSHLTSKPYFFLTSRLSLSHEEAEQARLDIIPIAVQEVSYHFTFQLNFKRSNMLSSEGNGNPLQDSFLENPTDGGACRLQSIGSQRVRRD